ncbi:MAG: hypothetical protein ACKO67_00415 [Bacteroidota bacterium]
MKKPRNRGFFIGWRDGARRSRALIAAGIRRGKSMQSSYGNQWYLLQVLGFRHREIV